MRRLIYEIWGQRKQTHICHEDDEYFFTAHGTFDKETDVLLSCPESSRVFGVVLNGQMGMMPIDTYHKLYSTKIETHDDKLREAAKILLSTNDKGMRTTVYDACAKTVKAYKFDAVLRKIIEAVDPEDDDV